MAEREQAWFTSGGVRCAAWHYPGTNGACVVMASGAAVPKEPGTDPFARAFHAAGFTVLAFDYRFLGESGGHPRQLVDVRAQLADWAAALDLAASLPGAEAGRIAAWGFSLSGGHVLRVAASLPVAAVVAQSPFTDGTHATLVAGRHQTVGGFLRLTGTALLDLVGGWFGLSPRLVPLAGEPGAVALLTTPDGNDGDRALAPDGRCPDWPRTVTARTALRLGGYWPGRVARRIRCPLLVVACDDDQSVGTAPAVRAAAVAPRGELVRLAGGHYAPFLAEHDRAVEVELDFLRRRLLADA